MGAGFYIQFEFTTSNLCPDSWTGDENKSGLRCVTQLSEDLINQ